MRRALSLSVLALGLAFCSSDDDDALVCDPGRQVTCPCDNGQSGVQICRSDGEGYEPCQCHGIDGGADGSAGNGGAAGNGASGGTGATGGSGGASGSGGAPSDGGASCPAGSATNVTGACDLLKQDCGGGLTCRIQQEDGGAWTAACVDLGDGPKQLGEGCANHAECAAGLSCALAKCTRPCCSEQEAAICGTGSCDLQITYDTGAGAPFMTVCTFSPPCTPWTGDCPPGPESDCHLAANGKLACSFPNYATDGGSTLGQPCQFLNDCADSQQCDFASGSGVCRWLCKVAGASGAPDAGVAGGAPGSGGCPTGQTCVAYTNPSWLGVCRP